MTRASVLLLLSLVAPAAMALPLAGGSVVVAYEPERLAITYPAIPRPLQAFSAEGLRLGEFGRGTAVAASGIHIYTSGSLLRWYDLNLALSGTAASAVDGNGGIAVSRDGTFYAVSRTSGQVELFTGSGLVRTLQLPYSDLFPASLAVDGCVLWYVENFRAHRYDACKSQALADPAPGQLFNFVRPIVGGFVGGQGNIVRVFDDSRHLQRSIVVSDFYVIRALSFSDDGGTLWVAGGSESNQPLLVSVSLDGRVLARTALHEQALAVAVVGEKAPTLESLVTAVPTLSEISRFMLFAAMLICAMWRLA
ncbi:MAG: hypothetical protein ABI837_14640 [Acidobacteriota bacterium]